MITEQQQGTYSMLPEGAVDYVPYFLVLQTLGGSEGHLAVDFMTLILSAQATAQRPRSSIAVDRVQGPDSRSTMEIRPTMLLSVSQVGLQTVMLIRRALYRYLVGGVNG